MINFGSFFASLLMPLFLRHLGPAVAFGVPGALMFISTAILWAGRKKYVIIPPAPPNPHSFLRLSRDAIKAGLRGQLLAVIAVARTRIAAKVASSLKLCWRPRFGRCGSGPFAAGVRWRINDAKRRRGASSSSRARAAV